MGPSVVRMLVRVCALLRITKLGKKCHNNRAVNDTRVPFAQTFRYFNENIFQEHYFVIITLCARGSFKFFFLFQI